MRPAIACLMCITYCMVVVLTTFFLLCVNGLVGFMALGAFCLLEPLAACLIDLVGGPDWVSRTGGRR